MLSSAFRGDGVIKKSFAKIPPVLPLPHLIQVQLNSFRWFQEEGLKELLEEFSPIQDFNRNRFELQLLSYEFRKPKYSEAECSERDMTYEAPLWMKVRLRIKETGEIKEANVFMGNFPLMTSEGVFIINGAERVVVSQLIRSPGIYFTLEEDITSGRELCWAKLIPEHGAWLEFETSSKDVISVKIDGKRRIPVTTLLRAIGHSEERWQELFQEAEDKSAEHSYIQATIAKESDSIKDKDASEGEKEALKDIYSRLRPGDLPNLANAREWINNLFFNARRYDLGKVGRYKLNKRLGRELLLFSGLCTREQIDQISLDEKERRLAEHYSRRVLTPEDFVAIVCHMIIINNGREVPDDIDHLGNRRLRTVGELLLNQLRIGFMRLERMIKERMSIIEPSSATPSGLINTRPLVAAVREFFGGSQLSQFMDQTNPLAELTHKRRLSALGPGGLSRERAGFEVRDIHFSHYGRICPIETPEGPNIGLLSSLATYGVVNEYGLIETPYRKVMREAVIDPNEMQHKPAAETISDAQGNILVERGKLVTPEMARQIILSELGNRTVLETVVDTQGKMVIGKEKTITPETAQRLLELFQKKRLPSDSLKVVPFVSNHIIYLSADKEEQYVIAQATAVLNQNKEFLESKVEVRKGGKFLREIPERIELMDVSPKQIVSIATSLIPFLEHDDANRALMGSNMQRQAVPLLRPEVPLVGTGMERAAAQYSGQLVFAEADGEVISLTAQEIQVRNDKRWKCTSCQERKEQPFIHNGEVPPKRCPKCSASGENFERNVEQHLLKKFTRTNQGTCINQRPIVQQGEQIRQGQVLADSSATDQGELALGQNVLCAFMSWEGYNFEDAIIISEELLKEDKFTSVHMERYKTEARETKQGPEEITRDIPNVGEENLRDLDEQGIILPGAEVEAGDMLVGKITFKGETELSAEEKLLRAIFGEKARDVKDTSLRIPHGERGTVIAVKVFDEDNHNDLPVGVNKSVRVWIAQKRKLSVGDKLAGRHGNKGVIACILPREDMPFLPDGTPVDIILNPIGVPSRMNIGQVLEAHLGWAAQRLGFSALSPVFEGADDVDIEDALARMWLAQQAKAIQWEPREQWSKLDGEQVNSWLSQRGYEAAEVFSDQCRGKARRACLQLWLKEQGIEAAALGDKELGQLAEKVSQEKGIPSPLDGKVILRDGHSGESFEQPVTVGYIYMMKLIHLVEDKIHARSTGPYSLITQQPLGGKAQFGGQRFGEMEVWALEAYGAANILQELLTIKSDDVSGRAKAYESIIKGDDISPPGIPESFKVLVKELQSLGLEVETSNEGEKAELPEEKIPGRPLLSDDLGI